MLGKLVRVDVDGTPDAGGYPAAAGNPDGEKYFHIGLRNPWRMSFDGCNGDLYIGDVLYLESLRALGTEPLKHDVRFVEDDWESPTLGAWGLGWQVWLDGLEISQFTYFQQAGGIDCKPVSGELTYGVERIAMYLQDKDTVYDLAFNDHVRYGDVFQRAEWEWSTYNFEEADVKEHFAAFDRCEAEVRRLLYRGGQGVRSQEGAGASCVRLRGQGIAPLQRPRRARRHQRHRTTALHRSRARPRPAPLRKRSSRSARRSASRCSKAA